MCSHRDRQPGRADRGGEVTGRAHRPGRWATGLAARLSSLPYRQLAWPAALFFLWPPRPRTQTSTPPGRQR
jgi:hypothetical protein